MPIIKPDCSINYRLFLAVVALLVSACSGQRATNATVAQEIRHFDQTGFSVSGDFLRFYKIYGAENSLGYPISKEMVDGGWRVQYFENGRLEHHPENDPTYRVTVGWLGDLLNRRRPPIPVSGIPPTGTANRRYYPKTGHTLSGDFLHYFDEHGGSVRFGLPISDPFLWQGTLTQDFQSARFFWLPENTPSVRLENTGRLHLEKITTKKQGT